MSSRQSKTGFWNWILHTERRLAIPIAILTFLHILIWLASIAGHWIDRLNVQFNLIADIGQALIILLYLVLFSQIELKLFSTREKLNDHEIREALRINPDRWHDLKRSCNHSMRRIFGLNFAIWSFWFVLYVLIAISDALPKNDPSQTVLYACQSLFNTCSTVVAIMIFNALTKGRRDRGVIKDFPWIALFLVVLLITILPITGLVPLQAAKVTFYSLFCVGLLGGIACMMLFSRLMNKFMSLPGIVVVLLCLFTSIQPTVLLLNTDHLVLVTDVELPADEITAVLSILKGIALLGKVTFGAVIGYALTNWRLNWMLLNSRAVEENIDTDIERLKKIYADENV